MSLHRYRTMIVNEPDIRTKEQTQLSPADLATTTVRRRSRKAVFLIWLRKVHLYMGLWGAIMGLLFGGTGILLNHRAILKIPVEKTVTTKAQLKAPAEGFVNPEALSSWVQSELQFKPVSPPLIRVQPPAKVEFAGRDVEQPARWTVNLTSPGKGIQAEYYEGNRFVNLDRTDATVIGTLTRLHMSVGVNAFWVLLSDTIAGGLILLSITGLLLWTQLHTVRTVAVLAAVGAPVFGLLFFTVA
jgi:hypothetical protein